MNTEGTFTDYLEHQGSGHMRAAAKPAGDFTPKPLTDRLKKLNKPNKLNIRLRSNDSQAKFPGCGRIYEE